MLRTGILTILVSAAASAGALGVDVQRPNILLVMVDDLGCEWLSCYGGESLRTPVLDRLAAGGMRFTNAYSMPQCTPTRVSLLTGRYPFRHGWVNHWDVPRWGSGCHFDPGHYTTFARLLKSAGYATAAAGKWQINDFRVQPDAMKRHGFDDWCMWTGFETNNPPSAERYWDPYINTPAGSRTYEGRFGADVFTDFLVDFMKRHRGEPMLLYFPMALTHTPFVSTPLEPEATGNVERHKAMVGYVEHCVDRLVNALDELNLRERTIIIFITDNGTTPGLTARMNGRDVRGGKATLGEPGINAPFIVNCPGLVPAGAVTDALTDFTDILPTLADLAGVKSPADPPVDGVSIADVLLGKSTDSKREWILSMGFGPAAFRNGRVEPKVPLADRAIRDKRYKLWVIDGKPAKLFDLKTDPGESENLLASENAEIVAAREHLEAVLASLPKRDANPQYTPLLPQSWDKHKRDSVAK